MKLVPLSKNNARVEWAFLHTIPSENGFGSPCEGVDYDSYLNDFWPRYEKESKGIDLAPGYVPQTIFIAYEDDIPVGVAKVRLYVNSSLRKGAGHIGYCIAKEHRGKGYAPMMLKEAFKALQAMDDFHDEYIFLSCNKDNIASLKTQLSAGMMVFREDEEEYYTLYDYHGDGRFEPSNFDPDIKSTVPFVCPKDHSYHKAIICFFHEQIQALLQEGKIVHFDTLKGENDLVIYRFVDKDILLVPGLVGGPLCGGFMDELVAGGVNEFLFVGGAGVLESNLECGGLMLVDSALREDGFSFHYAPKSRKIRANRQSLLRNAEFLKKRGIPFREVCTYTTDGFYRETKKKIALAKADGASCVEMEQASLIALALLRGVNYSAILYGGDDLSGTSWDGRSWHSRSDVRAKLVEIAKDILA